MHKNLNKLLFSFLTLIGFSLSSYGASVSVNVAQTVGANFLIEKGVAGVNSPTDITLTYTASTQVDGNTIIDYYVFNATGTKAFVMVSGDNNIIPILAYSNTSLFNYGKISPDAKFWIEGYKNQITAAITNNVPAKAGSAALWSELTDPVHTGHHVVTSTTAVAPLVQTTWDQYGVHDEVNYGSIPAYNAYCPNTSTTGGLSVTGCVATAMSQVMKFWNWPTVGTGYHTYYDAYNSSEESGSNTWNSFDYANTAFDWAHMPLDSSNGAVARLMYAAGVSVNMSYSNAGSGAYVATLESNGVNSAEYALQAYFHYKPTLHSALRTGVEGSYLGQMYEYYHGSVNIDSFNEASWISLLQNELSLGHPMLYDGEGSDGGHCWVCDGWETTDDMFHFNWGWSGYGPDGYYTVDNLSPPVLGAGGGGGNFNSDQGVIMGIVPDSFPTNVPGNIELVAHLNTSTNIPLEYGTPFTVTTKILNSGSSSFSGSFCVQLFDTANNFITNLDTVTGVTVAPGATSSTLTFNCNSWALTSMIFSGISIAYQATGTSTWTTVANNDTFINYGIVGQLVDTTVALFDSLHVGSHTIQQGSPMTITTKVGNNGYGSVSAAVEAILVNTATGSTFTVQSHTSESLSTSGTNFTFTNPDISVPAGLYALEIKHQYSGAGTYYTTSGDYFLNPILITVTCAPNTGIISGATAVCAGSSVTLSDTASGGSGTWSLSNSSIATVSGGVVTTTTSGVDTVKYSLTNSCGTGTSVAVLNIQVLPTPAAISGLDTVCTGGTISLSDATTGGTWSSAGTGIISVGGSGVVTGVSTGTDNVEYTVTNTCGSVAASLSVYVSPTPFPTAGTISSTSSPVCLGTSINVSDTADGSGGVWSSHNTGIATVSTSGIVSGVTAGNDTVIYTVTNFCGSASTSIVVGFETFPSAGVIAGPDTACVSGSTITLSDAITGGLWSVTNGNASISGGIVTGASLGTDTVLYIVSNLCGADTAQTTITVADCETAVNNVAAQSDIITLYPNPTTGSINISSTGTIKTVVISNVVGQEILTKQYNTKEVEVNLNQLPAGVYMVRVNDTKVYKIVKQ